MEPVSLLSMIATAAWKLAPLLANLVIARNDSVAIAPSNRELEERQWQIQRELEQLRNNNQIALQRQQLDQQIALQQQLAVNNRETQLQLQEKRLQIQLELEQLRSNNQIALQRQQLEQQKELQQQLAGYNRETQLQLAAYQRETALQRAEVHKLFENWPLILVPSQILNSHRNQTRLPLRIFLSPPKVQYDRFVKDAPTMPEIEPRLAGGLGDFLGQHYSLHSLERPTEFLSGAWESRRFRGQASIRALFEMLKSEPTLILESEIDGDYLNFRIGYWGLGQENYYYQNLARFPYRDMLYDFAKNRALKWKETSDKLLALGRKPEEIIKLGGDNAINLKTLEDEAEFKAVGIDTRELSLNYKINAADFEALNQVLINCHCLVAGWMADIHHLIHADTPPLLPLLPELTQNAVEPQVIESIVRGYQSVYQALETERPAWVPDLSLQLALSVAHLPDKSWAKQQVYASIKAWLQQRQVQAGELMQAIDAMLPIVVEEDREYLEKLKECFVQIGDSDGNNAFVKVQGILQNLEDLKNRKAAERLRLEAERRRYQEEEERRQRQAAEQARLEAERRRQEEEKRRRGQFVLDKTLARHSNWVRSVAFSPNGEWLASGSDDNTIKIWQLATGKEHRTLKGHSNSVWSVAFSPNGELLASGSWDNTIKIWQLATGKELRTLTGHSNWVFSVAFSPNGEFLASGSRDNTIKIWRLI